MIRVLAALLALPFAVTAVAAQDTRPTVAVLYFDNNSIGRDAADFAGIGKGVAELLINDVAGSGKVRVVERERIEALLQERNLTREGAIDAATAIEIGKLLGAHYMITGGFMHTDRQTVLTARTIDVETGVISNPQRVQQSGDDVLGLIGQLSERLVAALDLPALERRTGDAGHGAHHGGHGATQAGTQAADAATASPAPAAQAVSNQGKLDVRTALLFSRALEAQDAGDRARAIALYDQVLDRFPNLESARANRDRLQSSGT